MVLMKGEAITAGSNPIFSAKMGREAPTSLAPGHRAHQGAAHHRRHGGRYGGVGQQPAVHHHHLHKVGRRQAHAADQRHAALLPHHAQQIAESDLPQRQGADHRRGGLGAAVAAGAGEHGDVGGQNGHRPPGNSQSGSGSSP